MLTLIQRQESTNQMDNLDHLFLLPERALSMDATRLQKDLEGLNFDPRLLHEAPMGNIWLSGSRPSSAAKEDTKARLKSVKERENEERQKKLDELKAQAQAAQRFKEKKEMERKMRIEEMKLKEDSRRQQVEERKKMMNEAERDRLEAILRRNQEREARIEAKKRNERHSMVFAFGSSTPRMLQPTDSIGSFWGHRRATSTQNITSTAAPLTRRQSERELDGGSKKRATSAGGLERSIEAPPSPQVPAGCASGYVGRRRTDLMPTIPSRESPSVPSRKSFTRSPGRAYSMSRLDQLAKPRKRPELPVLAETAGSPPLRTLNRPQQSSVSRSMSHLAVNKAGPQPQRPLRKSDSRSMHQLSAASPLPPPRTTRATQLRQQKLATGNNLEAPSRPSSSLSQQSTSSITSSVNMRTRPIAAPRRPRPVSIAVTGISSNGMLEAKKPTVEKPPLPKTRKSSLVKSTEKLKKKSITSPTDGSPRLIVSPTSTQQANSPIEVKSVVKEKIITKEMKNDDKQVVATIIATEELITNTTEMVNDSNVTIVETTNNTAQITEQLLDLSLSDKTMDKVMQPLIPDLLPTPVEKELAKPVDVKEQSETIEKHPTEKTETIIENQPIVVKPLVAEKPPVSEKPLVAEKPAVVEKPPVAEKPLVAEKPPVAEKPILEKSLIEEKVENCTSTANSGEFTESSEMTTSMTKVRINTEEEAKAALAERRRLAREEAERQAEMERQRIAEEERLERERQQREEEQQRILIEKLRQEEQQRLEEAIKEAQKREEEEIQRREEENRIKLLKEESERRAREEAERQKAELQERLKNEEKEREARRKRVEAIMLRTRGKNNSIPQQQTEEKNEENTSEKINGSKVDIPENGHKHGKDIETVDNIIPVETLKNANNVDNLSTDDTLNSNNAWQHNTQTDLLM